MFIASLFVTKDNNVCRNIENDWIVGESQDCFLPVEYSSLWMPRMNIAWRTFVGALNAIGSVKITVRKLFWRFANENNVCKQAVVLMIMNVDSAVLPT